MRTVVAIVVLVVLVAIVRAVVTPYHVPSVHLTPAQCAQLPAGTEGC